MPWKRCKYFRMNDSVQSRERTLADIHTNTKEKKNMGETFNITVEMLRVKGACMSGIRDFLKEFPREQYPDGADYQEVLNRCAENERPNYAEWLLNEFGATNKTLSVDKINTDGYVFFAGRIEARGEIRCKAIRAGREIKAGEGIKAGGGIKAGWGIEAGGRIEAGGDIKTNKNIKAGCGIKAGREIKAGEGIKTNKNIKAGCGIKADEDIKAGWGIEAGWGIKAGGDFGVYAGLAVRLSDKSQYAKITAKEKPANIICGEWVPFDD